MAFAYNVLFPKAWLWIFTGSGIFARILNEATWVTEVIYCAYRVFHFRSGNCTLWVNFFLKLQFPALPDFPSQSWHNYLCVPHSHSLVIGLLLFLKEYWEFAKMELHWILITNHWTQLLRARYVFTTDVCKQIVYMITLRIMMVYMYIIKLKYIILDTNACLGLVSCLWSRDGD